MDKSAENSTNIYNETFNNSFDSDIEQDPFKKLVKLLTSFYLNSLETIFNQKIKDKPSSAVTSQKERGLTKSEFVEAVNDVYGEENYTAQAIELFNEIDKQENYEITWMQLLDYLTNTSKVKPYPKLEFGNHKIAAIPHVMRDTIVKIVLIESEKFFCYAIISKYGRVGLYDGNMNFLISYHVIMTKDDITRTDRERRRRNRWITDAIYLPDIFMLFIINSTRSITIYDASGLKHVPLWLIIGYPNIICSMSYYLQESTNTNIIYVGDDSGLVTSFTFLQSKMGLFRRKHNDKLSVFYWIEMRNETEFVIVKNLYKAHNERIRKVKYFPNEKVLVTCSCDAKSSVVIKNLIQKRDPYIFRMRRGSNCFDLSPTRLITGSDDGTIRVWNPVITAKPLAILKKHESGIVDIVNIEFLQFFISCSRDGVLKLWDTKSETCVQSVTFKFPAFKVFGKTIEWGTNSIYPGPKRQSVPALTNITNEMADKELITESETLWQRSHIIITCCNYISTVNMIFLDEKYRKNFDLPVLIPPPLQNSVLIPNSWNVGDKKHFLEEFNSDDTSSDSDDSSSSNFTCDNIDIDDKIIEQRLESLKFILDKNLLDELGLKTDINQKIAQLEAKKTEMLLNVERCAPFLALDLHDVEEIKLNENLPVPNRKNIRSLVDGTQRMLSAASSRTQIFSEATSSSRLTSRSSIVEFD